MTLIPCKEAGGGLAAAQAAIEILALRDGMTVFTNSHGWPFALQASQDCQCDA